MIKNRQIDISGLSERDAIKRLCEEINLLRSELTKSFETIDGGTVVLSDGTLLEEHILKGRK